MLVTPDIDAAIRKQYAGLIDALAATGQTAQARACAELAARHGVWKHPLQRPTAFDPSLPQTPLYDPAQFWFVAYLEQQFPVIRDEVSAVVDPRQAGFSPVDEPLVGKGRWDEVVFYENGIRMEQPCARFPRTAEVMARIPEALASSGVIMLSWLHPGSHIIPHCGATNTRLRVHMGVRVPQGASMRVGDQRFVWQEGRCVVFDDSFEHEVWNLGQEPRVVLLFDVPHPALPVTARAARRDSRVELAETVGKFLAAHGIASVERDEQTGELIVVPDEATGRTITRYMQDQGVTRVQRTPGGLVIE
jgi:aspartate beta-hydroxylase